MRQVESCITYPLSHLCTHAHKCACVHTHTHTHPHPHTLIHIMHTHQPHHYTYPCASPYILTGNKLEEQVYMVQPPGFHSSTNTSAVCRLRKSLYELKQAPRAWNVKITQQLRWMGFATLKSDSSLFIRKGRLGRLVFYCMLMTWSSPAPT